MSAFSIDGRRFEFAGADPLVASVGSFVRLEAGDGARLGQILDARPDRGGRTTSGHGRLHAVLGHGDSISQLDEHPRPFAEARLERVRPDALRRHLWAPSPHARLEIGHLTQMRDVSAGLAAGGLARHTFMCGQSGSGKTYTLGIILERLMLETDLRILVLDPNSDYVRLPELVEDGLTGAERERWQGEIAPRMHVLTDERLRIHFGRLGLAHKAMVLSIDPIASPELADALREIVEASDDPDQTLEEIRDRAAARTDEPARQLRMRIDNSGIARLRLWARRGEAAVLDGLRPDWRSIVVDLGSLATPLERSIVASSAASWIWNGRAERIPTLVVVDEAHNICPQVPTDEHQKAAMEHLIAIAGEGRKYGLYLLVATQRPQKVHESVISQCENLILMRMTSLTDVAALETVFSFVPAGLIEASVLFRLGEGLAAGRIAPAPLLFRSGARWSLQGGSDVPMAWAMGRQSSIRS